ncbi:MAG: DUF72 domain-containing protein, partial [Acidobacteriota bacterium]
MSVESGGSPDVRVGTSGWNYSHWRGRFYPRSLPPARWLAYLSGRLATVEVNGTFYSLTRPAACDAWRASVPEDFLFAVKGSRYITHMLKLRNFRDPLANFFSSGILRLGTRLGPILWQLPPQLTFDAARANDFLSALPRDVRAAERWARRHDTRTTGRAALTAPDGRDRRIFHALEVRHESWVCDAALALLERHGIALVAADTAGKHPHSLARTSRDLAYVRLHGARRLYEGAYTDEELREWAQRCRAWAAEGAGVFVYFDNDGDAQAVEDAQALQTLIRGGSPNRQAESADVVPAPRPAPAHFGFRRRGAEAQAGRPASP